MDAATGDQEQAIRTALEKDPVEPRNRNIQLLMTLDPNKDIATPQQHS
jgi:hypothetical protein